jgi:hypothetical protein
LNAKCVSLFSTILFFRNIFASKITVFRDVTSYSSDEARRFGGIYCLHLQCRRAKNQQNIWHAKRLSTSAGNQ